METFAIRISSIILTTLLLTLVGYCCCPTQTKDLCKIIGWLPNFIKKKRTRTYKIQQQDRSKKNDILLQKLAAQMIDITRKQQQAEIIKESQIPKRWSSAVQLAYPFSRTSTPVPTPRTTITTQTDDINVHMPPQMASPTLSYIPKTLDDTNTSTPHTTPTQTSTTRSKPIKTSVFHRLGRRPRSLEITSIASRLYHTGEKSHRRD